MSFDALAWAAKQTTGSSGTKLVLLGLAECADRSHNLAFPSIAALVEFSCLDRKSVISNLTKLEAIGLIADTGRKVGKTQQIKVYKLNLETVPKTEQSQKRNSTENSANSPKNGTRNKSEPVTTEAEASYKSVGDLWNSLSVASGIPEIRIWNNSRKQMCNARVKEHGLPAILEGVRKIHRSAFCRGESGDGRKQDIMLLLQPATCARVLEGFYGEDGEKGKPPTVEEQLTRLRDLIPFYEKINRMEDADECRRKIAALERPANPEVAAKVVALAKEAGKPAQNFSGRVAAR